MKRRTEKAPKQRERGLWYSILTVILPVFALAVAAAFVLLCVTFGAVRPAVTIELGEEVPEVGAFLRKDGTDAAYAVEPNTHYSKAGDYRLLIRVGGRTVPVTLRVRDTQPPTADGTETTVPAKQVLSPEKLIRNLRDCSIVRVSYEVMPDYNTVGDYEAIILLEDESGNRTRVPATVHVRTVVDGITREAGDPAPTAEAFLIGTYAEVSVSRITESMMREPGTYPVRITADGIEAESLLTVRDTVAPTGSSVTCIALPGEQVRPDMLVTAVTDETAVTAVFAAPPDPDSLEPQTVEVILTDRGGNETRIHSTLLFSNIKPVEIEAHTWPLAVTELLEEGTYTEASLDMTYVPNDPGLHVLAIMIDGKQNLAVFEIKDTTPPVLEVAEGTFYRNTPVTADALVHVWDATETTLTFAAEPDWTQSTQSVTVCAVDTSGNRSELTFSLTLVPDVEPPVLYGVRDRYCYQSEPVAYLAEVSAWDACDGAVEVTADASAVDLERVGRYPVIYSATDRAGNTTSKTVVFTVITVRVSEERANQVAKKILKRILTDDMTLPEQIEAIYNYVFYHVHYSAISNKQDWRSEAVRGLTTGRGDCFTAYAAARLLLEHTDAQILSVQRSGPNTHHYWLLVNVGTGWYHYDACRAFTGKKRCFMWTDAQTRRVSRSYWRYDKTLYPAVATELYNGGN